MNCPRCRIRQLDSYLRCGECNIQWRQEQLDYFDERMNIFQAEYEEELEITRKKFEDKRQTLLKATIKLP
jgi:hypothetical protein